MFKNEFVLQKSVFIGRWNIKHVFRFCIPLSSCNHYRNTIFKTIASNTKLYCCDKNYCNHSEKRKLFKFHYLLFALILLHV